MKLAQEEPMTAPLQSIQAEEEFHTADVITVAAAHGAHDTFFSYLPTILPLLIQNLSLSTTQAGLLSAANQIPNLLQPVIGHLADRKNLKLLVVLAPALSGMLITLIGLAPTFNTAAVLLLLAGFSTAGFHAIAPAMVGAHSGKRVGRGMGFFMVGGELGFGIGPLVVVAAIALVGLRGLPWLMIFGFLASAILYFRLKTTSTVRPVKVEATLPVMQAIRQMSSLLAPIMLIVFMTGFLIANIVNYLPTFMSGEGFAFAFAGISLAVVELGGTLGVFTMSLVSDRLGQRTTALLGILASAFFAAGFLLVHGWLQVVLLAATGMTAFVANPAFLAMIQSRYHANRSLANGMYMSTSFLIRSGVVVLVGFLADLYGFRPVFWGSVLASLLSVPLIFFLPAD